jgi:DNA-directed RNA polymerase
VKANRQGVKNFAMVHDSYGCLATETSKMCSILREVFVDMYKGDVLEKFRDEIMPILNNENQKKVPPLPEKGDLDINLVLESDYFFC